MSGFLFSEVIFGPIKSRRLGISLGINLMPTNKKICNFNCIYCECGWTEQVDDIKKTFCEREVVYSFLEEKLKLMSDEGDLLDSITFAGNGEPTLHPDFAGIVDDVILLRNKYYPEAKVTVLSNSLYLSKKDVFDTLLKVDNNILKLDAGTDKTFRQINRANKSYTLEEIVDNLKRFKGNVIIQTLFLKGEYEGEFIDNTTDEEVAAWLKCIIAIKPAYVMIYPIDRATPAADLIKLSRKELEVIAEKARANGIETKVYE